MSLRLKCGQIPPNIFFYNKAMVPLPATPSPSEHGEWLDSQYELAWNLWLLAHHEAISEKRFVRLATQLDETPEASEYFRWLCCYELWCIDYGIPVPVNYLNQWCSSGLRKCPGTGRSRRTRSRPRRRGSVSSGRAEAERQQR